MKKFYIALTIIGVSLCCSSQSINISLQQSLNYATIKNPFLKTYFEDVELANIELEKSKLRTNPVFNAQLLALLDHSYYPNKPLIISRTNRQDWFQLTKKLQPWGQRKNNIRFYKNLYEQEQTNLLKTLYENKYQTALKWLEAWHSKVAMELTNTAVKSLDSLIKKNAKDTSSLVYLRYLILDDQYDMEFIDAQNDFQNKISDLKLSIGIFGEIDIDSSNFFYLSLPSKDTLIQYALQNHVDVVAKKQEIQTNLANVKLQKSLALPGPEVGILENPQNKIPYTGLFFTQTLPIFDKNSENINKAKLQIDQSNSELDAISLAIKETVHIKHVNYLTQIQKQKQMLIAKLNSNRLLHKVRATYARDNTSPVDMWEAEITWFDVHKAYYLIEYELRKAYIDLLYVSGKLE